VNRARRGRGRSIASTRRRATDIDARVPKGLQHQLRARTLSILSDRIASPQTIAAELGVSVGTVGHHAKLLEAPGCIEPVCTRPRRGATEHFYRGLADSLLLDAIRPHSEPDVRTALSIGRLRAAHRDAREALVADTFDAREGRHLSRSSPVAVDERGWRELVELLGKAAAEVAGIEARSSRRASSGKAVGTLFRVIVALMSFEAAPEEGRP
jgi:biotin operon repressor